MQSTIRLAPTKPLAIAAAKVKTILVGMAEGVEVATQKKDYGFPQLIPGVTFPTHAEYPLNHLGAKIAIDLVVCSIPMIVIVNTALLASDLCYELLALVKLFLTERFFDDLLMNRIPLSSV